MEIRSGYQAGEAADSYSKSIRKKEKAARRKAVTRKKSLNYNHREVSGMLLRAKHMQSASAALTLAKSKLGSLKRSAATGQYDRTEVSRAVTHAQRMVQCAELKVRNMKQEDMEKRRKTKEHSASRQQRKSERKQKIRRKKRQEEQKRAIRQLAQVQSQKNELRELERKKRSNRREENSKVLEADMKYIRAAMERESNSDYEAERAAILELGGIEVAEASETSVSSAANVSSSTGTGTGTGSADVGGASVDVAI